MSSTTIKPTKTLTGTRTIRGIKYDFEMIAKLNLDDRISSCCNTFGINPVYSLYLKQYS